MQDLKIDSPEWKSDNLINNDKLFLHFEMLKKPIKIYVAKSDCFREELQVETNVGVKGTLEPRTCYDHSLSLQLLEINLTHCQVTVVIINAGIKD